MVMLFELLQPALKVKADAYIQEVWYKVLTRGGRHSSACLLRTENPPWVLVSDAVRVLQKEYTKGFGGSGGRGSLSTEDSSCCEGDDSISAHPVHDES